jgi:polar amino acid transport system substrate-binding protein
VRPLTHARNRPFIPFTLITVGTLLLTARGSGADDTATTSARADAIPTTDVVSAIKKDDAAAKLLPRPAPRA